MFNGMIESNIFIPRKPIKNKYINIALAYFLLDKRNDIVYIP